MLNKKLIKLYSIAFVSISLIVTIALYVVDFKALVVKAGEDVQEKIVELKDKVEELKDKVEEIKEKAEEDVKAKVEEAKDKIEEKKDKLEDKIKEKLRNL